MKIKVSDYIADFFANNGIKHIFTVVGGGAMHLNDSFGHHPNIHCIYNHHEQACSMAADGYYRVNNEMAGVCVTSGPGAINALNGVVGAYQDSIPMIVVSGQTKSTLTVKNSGLKLRTLGNQEFDIISTLSNVCKYSEMVEYPEKIRYCLEKAFYIAKTGRPGPCWLDIPLDIQGCFIETDNLEKYPIQTTINSNNSEIQNKINIILEKIKNAKRPILYAGNGIRISNSKKIFDILISKLNIPVVTCWNSIDLIETDNKLYTGRAGIMGDRPGNFAVQNSDLLLCIGTRLNIYQVGFEKETWARKSYVIDIDIDEEELKKKTIHVDMPICCDAKIFMTKMIDCIKNIKWQNNNEKWIKKCNEWKRKYPVVLPQYYKQESPLNVYALLDKLSRILPKNALTVVANGSASVVGSAVYYIKKEQRFIMNCALSSMGFDLPAAIGACSAMLTQEKHLSYLVCIAGDGSIQMNIQELQTIVTNKLPIKIIVINNQGYHQIRLTQTNVFNKNFVGLGPESGDLDFPNFEKLSFAYNIPYFKCDNILKLEQTIKEFLDKPGYSLLEAICDTKQVFSPKSATKRREDGSLYSPPLEDLAPFLPREELEQNMFIDLIK